MLSRLSLCGYVCRAPELILHVYCLGSLCIFSLRLCHLPFEAAVIMPHTQNLNLYHTFQIHSFPTAIPSCPWHPACYLNCHEHWAAVDVWMWMTSILKCHIKYSWLRGLLWPTACWAFSLFIEVDCVFVRPRGMRGSPLGRSWPLAVSMTTDRLPSQAAARAAKTACPHGQCALVFSGLVVCLM